jgi:CubicO group peptidase (beta-lactamase class C family)
VALVAHEQLTEYVKETAERFGIPGVAVGILSDGTEHHVCHGVTSVGNPLPVDARTLFPIASISKTLTATAMLRLVADGVLDLDAPVRRYLPEFTLADEEAAERITILNLLNHTAGLDWNLVEAGPGEQSPAAFVTALAATHLIAEPGTRASYSQAGYNVAGRVLEKITGQPFQRAVATLLLTPLGLHDTVYDLDDVVIRRFAVGHNRGDDGMLRPARPWKAWPAGARANDPGGGAVSSVRDLLRWARCHLDGGAVLPADLVRRMRQPTAELRASSLGDAIGIAWFLRDIAGVATAGHAGSGNGQFSELLIVPEHGFAVVSLANAGPDGYRFNQEVVRWTIRHYLGLRDDDPVPVPYDATRAQEVAGRYEIDAMNIDIATDGATLTLAAAIKSEIRRDADTELPPDYPPAAIGFLSGGGDEYIVTEGGLKGQRGYFSRDAHGAVRGIDLAGRYFAAADR